MTYKILVVDDEKDIRDLLQDVLEDAGYSVITCADGHSALESVCQHRPDAVLLDIWLGDASLDGIKVLDNIHKLFSGIAIIMMSGHGTITLAVDAMKKGAYDFLEKPFKSNRLLVMLEQALEVFKLKNENQVLRLNSVQPDFLLSETQYLSQLKQSIAKAATSNSRILISGPAGIGKKTAASEIHKSSSRASGPYILFNCATHSKISFDNIFFGEEKNVNGQLNCKEGILEKTHHGTLVLDNIAEMPLSAQSKLAQFLRDGVLQRLGSSRKMKADVRFITITNDPLSQALSEGKLLEELASRLNVTPVSIRPLCQRKEDIVEFTKYFLHKLCDQYLRPPINLSDEMINALQAYHWPGNIKQLKNIMEWIVMTLPDNYAGDLKPNMINFDMGATNEASLQTADSQNSQNVIWKLPLKEAKDIFEKNYLSAQINRFSGNISQTAAFIGMERSALHRKLRSLGIVRNNDL